MEFTLGVVCGRCDAYSVLGTASCACGHPLALGPQPKAMGATASSASTGATTGAPKAAVQARTGLDEPTSSLFGTDELKPRRGPSRAIGAHANAPGGPSVAPAASTAVRHHAHAAESALSSSPAFDPEGSPDERAAPRARPEPSLEELMEQAKNYVCKSCSTPVPLGHKFCGRCGAAIPPDILNARTQFFGQLQAPGKAKLILIRGEGVEGLSYQLNAEQHVLGRNGQIVFPDDPFISPRHANMFYRGGKLVVRDEGSYNGVFWRVRGSVEVAPGDHFLAGEQLFRVEGAPRPNDGPAPDGTYFYSSPKHPAQFKVVQILEGGAAGMAVCARTPSLQIGREGGDLNFPGDLYMSASHCKLEESGGKLTLTDLNSRNGTFVRIKAERELAHGDYVFIGRKLLRVEITAN